MLVIHSACFREGKGVRDRSLREGALVHSQSWKFILKGMDLNLQAPQIMEDLNIIYM